ncbi:MAG: UDP-3-O-acyl-N-acetylglucosamine deacetylase [Fimbriimonadaceae bacterium]
MIFDRRTVASDVEVGGTGLHSGVPVSVKMRPGEAGIVFRCGSGKWEALPQNVTDTRLCTRLGDVSTIEHLMSALAGAEITDVDIELSAPELPALDGSALPFLQALNQASATIIGTRELPNLFTRVFVQQNDSKLAISRGGGHWRYVFETGDRWPGHQECEVPSLPVGYEREVAGARTFGFEEQIPELLAAGFAKGLNLETALILGTSGYNNDSKWPDEPARHKLLDAIGDLYLAGVPIRFLNVVAERTGHAATVQAANLLFQAVHPG